MRASLRIGAGAVSGIDDEQSLDALDFIVDGLESAFAEGYSDEQWQSIAEHLSEHVQNGLT